MLKQLSELGTIILDMFYKSDYSNRNDGFLVDEIIDNWTPKYGLMSTYEYKDEGVRSLKIVDNGGNSYQIWIELIGAKTISVLASNNRSKHQNRNWKIKGTLNNLEKNLDTAYSKVDEWIKETGNSRTFV